MAVYHPSAASRTDRGCYLSPSTTAAANKATSSRPPWDGHFNSAQRVYESSTNPLLHELGLVPYEEGHSTTVKPVPPKQRFAQSRPQSARNTAHRLASSAAKSVPKLERYDPLRDPSLRRYFQTTKPLFLHLADNGIVTNDGFVVEHAQQKMTHVERVLGRQQLATVRAEEEVHRALAVRTTLESHEKERLKKLAHSRAQYQHEVSQRETYRRRTESFTPRPQSARSVM